MAELNYTPQQRCAIENRGGALLVSAAAGSGKTRVLVERLMSRVTDPDSPVDVDRFLIITYTRAAVAELRGRIMEELSNRLAAAPWDRRLRRQAELIRHAHISTIHSFCTDVLREYAHAVDIQPGFRVAEDPESELIRARVLEDVLEARYDAIEQTPDFALLVDTMAAGRDDSKLEALVLDAHAKLQSHPYPDRWIEEQLKAMDLSACTDAGATPWGRLLMDRARDEARSRLRRLQELLDGADEELGAAYGPNMEDSIGRIGRFIEALDRGWDEAGRCAIFKSGIRVKSIKGHDAEKKVRTDCLKALEALAAPFKTTSAELIGDMEAMRPAVTALLRLVLDFDLAYAAEKRRRGVIDFHDQEHLAVQLLWDAENDCPSEAARRVADGFEEIMIDEYQDVNEVQERIFTAVSRDGKNVFMVGDVKQSIYRFRLADPTIFLRKYSTFADAETAEEGEPRRVILPENFRSRPGILDAVNFVFRNVMSTEFGGMDYTELESLKPGRTVPEPDFPPVELDIVSADAEDGEEETGRVETDAAFVATRIAELLSSGMCVPEGEGSRPLRASDIAVLLQAAKDKAWKYAYELTRRGIPSTVPTSEGFFDAPEISALTSLIAVIDNPLQDVPLISALRSPLFGVTGEELAQIRLRKPDGPFFEALRLFAEENEKCAAFLQLLARFRELAPEMSSDRLIWRVYGETGALAIYGAMTGGGKKRRNLMRLYELATSFEANGYQGLFAFNSMLRRMMEQGREPEGTDGGGGGDCVQIMTIHKSKGLEFPVVILADMAGQFNLRDSSQPLLFHSGLGVGAKCIDTRRRIAYPTLARMAITRQTTDETLFEQLRVLYVAMTRAREKLILSITMPGARKKIQRLAEDSSLPVAPMTLRGARSFAAVVLLAALSRPECAFLEDDSAPPPESFAGDAWIVRTPEGPFIAPSLPSAPAAAEEQLPPEPTKDLAYPYPMSETLPSKLTATELKGSFRFRESMEEAEITEAASGGRSHLFDRPRFITGETPLTAAEKGTALHLAMQYIDLHRCVDADGVREELLRLRERGFLTEKQAAAVEPDRIVRFLASDTGHRVLTADRIRRELKFSLLVRAEELYPGAGDDEILFQGVVDLCIEEAGEITVIDFKTDYVTPETIGDRAAHYTPQIRSYGMALRRMTGMSVKEHILYFLGMDEAVRV
ncbi:MAG: helicase-exonuclease AddAB subunit AddA [Oscillospiraceae bacterium]|nr:helicase-exonuclease AddAB subunit AddA [Oscillospiraceae bacterium]